MLRFRDVYPGSRIRLFFHPGSELFPSRIRIKEFKYFKPNKWFQSSRKYDPGCSSLILDPDPDFLPIPDPGSRGQKGTGSRIRNTAFCLESGEVVRINTTSLESGEVVRINTTFSRVW